MFAIQPSNQLSWTQKKKYYVDKNFNPRLNHDFTELSLLTLFTHIKYWLKIKDQESEVKITYTQSSEIQVLKKEGWKDFDNIFDIIKNITNVKFSNSVEDNRIIQDKLILKVNNFFNRTESLWFDENNQIVFNQNGSFIKAKEILCAPYRLLTPSEYRKLINKKTNDNNNNNNAYPNTFFNVKKSTPKQLPAPKKNNNK